MSVSYKFIKFSLNEDAKHVIKTTDDGKESVVPLFDPANIDYQEYLEWSKTNTTQAAD
tara:strand:- start:95 stop:268 length:174 start_codon:yes stop_codon:yes gene_type:complete